MANPQRPTPEETQSGRPISEVASDTEGALFLETRLSARQKLRRLGTHTAKTIWKQSGAKRARRVAVMVAILALAIYFVPVLTLVMIGCGVLDVRRHRKITYELVEKYFMGNGVLTWMLSPVNLLADLLSHRHRVTYTFEDLPAAHRGEIETCVREFMNHGNRIKAYLAPILESNKRCMLTFRWFNRAQSTTLRIPAFERNYRFIKTIAISVFKAYERTSWHFGPLRLTLRVLYNLEPVNSPDVFIVVDDRVHRWMDDSLCIFDDTAFHCSINGADQARYCLFMDIIRPNYCRVAFEVGAHAVSAIAGSLKTLFYKNWSFVR
jgi:aspartyl/asparaginyl beta-hydroxylase (cupin superfamily)